MDIRVLEIEKRYNKGKEEHWMLYAPASNIQGCQTWDNVKRLMPPDEDSEQEEEMQRRDPAGTKLFHIRAVWSILGPHYEAWLKGEVVSEDGIPMEAWSGANAGQVKALKRGGVNTINQLVVATEAQMSKINLPDLRDLKRRASVYLESADKSEMADRVANSEEKLEAALEVIAEMRAEMDAKKPKRGRPKIDQAAA